MPTIPSSLFYKSEGYFVGSIKFDLLISENHSIEANVTEHPLENGAVVSDHVRVLPRKGSLVGLVTNHPLKKPTDPLPEWFMDKVSALGNPGILDSVARVYGGLASPLGLGSKGPTEADFARLNKLTTNRAADTWGLFKRLVEAKEPVTISMGMEKPKNVIVTKVSTSHEHSDGESARFHVEFQQIKIVTLMEVEVLAATKPLDPTQGTAKAKKGKVGGKQVVDTRKPVYGLGGKLLSSEIYSGAGEGSGSATPVLGRSSVDASTKLTPASVDVTSVGPR